MGEFDVWTLPLEQDFVEDTLWQAQRADLIACLHAGVLSEEIDLSRSAVGTEEWERWVRWLRESGNAGRRERELRAGGWIASCPQWCTKHQHPAQVVPEDEGIHHDAGALRFFTDSDGERGGIVVVNEAWHVRGQMTAQVTIAGQTLVTDPDDLDELIRVLGTAATTLRAHRDPS